MILVTTEFNIKITTMVRTMKLILRPTTLAKIYTNNIVLTLQELQEG